MNGKIGSKGMAPADARKGWTRGAAGVALLAAALGMAILSAGCNKLKARDHLVQGENAFRAGNYSQAADEFHLAIDADPTFGTARLYLATAYEQQYVPGTETDANKKFWQAAMEQFHNVLKDDPKNLLATQSIANLYYQAATAKGPDEAEDLAKTQEWNKKVIEIDPKNKQAYYTLGVIPWQEFFLADREARSTLGMTPEQQTPLKSDTKKITLKADLKAKYWQPLTDGIEDEKKALAIDPQYEDAMSFMNLLIRYRADLEDTKDAYEADVKEADYWLNKQMETQKAKAKKKADDLASGATTASE